MSKLLHIIFCDQVIIKNSTSVTIIIYSTAEQILNSNSNTDNLQITTEWQLSDDYCETCAWKSHMMWN